jgi:hypothetical protein
MSIATNAEQIDVASVGEPLEPATTVLGEGEAEPTEPTGGSGQLT